MAETHRPAGDALKVFISYSRSDLYFADQIVAVLESRGFTAVIDRKGIQGAERWEERLGQMILQSDAIVFLLSPDSAVSKTCAWEVKEAARHGKRIIPAPCRPLEGAQPPEELRDLNYIYFYDEKDVPGSGFGTGQVRLIEALSVDIAWVREHTRLEELAARWDAGGRPADLLVRGSELATCRAWRDRRPANAPDLTALQRAFLGASEEEETARLGAERRRLAEIAAAQEARQKAIEEREAALKREAEAQQARVQARRVIVWLGAVAAVVVIAGMAAFAYVQTLNVARQLALTAEAQKERDLAENNFRMGQITESRFRAEQAKQSGDDAVTAALIALEGTRDDRSDDERQRTRPFVNEAWHELHSASLQVRERKVLSGRVSAVFSPDGQRIFATSDDETARLWDGDGKLIATLRGHTGAVISGVFSPDGRRILTASADHTARLWDNNGKAIATLQGHTGAVISAVFSADGRRFLTASADRTARLWDEDGKLIATLQGHTDSVWSAMFSPDEQRILTVSRDNTARLWDDDGKPIATLQGDADSVRSAVFSPDGRHILMLTMSSRHDSARLRHNTARLWDEDGKPIATLPGHTDSVLSAVFSPDGRRILTTSLDNRTRLFDAEGTPIAALPDEHDEGAMHAEFSPDGRRILTAYWFKQMARLWDADGKPIATLQGHTNWVLSAAFSRDGRRILTASRDSTARLWDAEGKPIATLQGHTASVEEAVFSPDGRHILTTSEDKTARLWDVVGKPSGMLQEGVDWVHSTMFSPDGRRILILTGSADRAARLWDGDGKPIGTLTQGVTSAVFSPDARRIFTAYFYKTARLWDADGKPVAKLQGYAEPVHFAVFSPDGHRILTASEDKPVQMYRDGMPAGTLLKGWNPDTVQLWNVIDGVPVDGEPIATLQGHSDSVRSAVFSPDGRRILTASHDNTARLWDANGKTIAILQGHTDSVRSAVFSSDGHRILTASADHTARLWDADGQLIAALQGHTGAVISAVFSPDGRRILTASADHTARLWDDDGKPVATLRGHTNGVESAMFSPDGHRILTAAFPDNTARLWDDHGKPVATLQGHTGSIRSAVFSPDGIRILTASEDNTARLWDAEGKLVATLRDTNWVRSAVFSPDGRRILTETVGSTARLWDAFPNPQDLVDRVKTEVPRCLTPEQRERLLLSPKPPRWCFTMQKWPYDPATLAQREAANSIPK